MEIFISSNQRSTMEGKGSVDKVFKGTYIHAVTLEDIEVVQNGGIGVSSTGDIVFAAKSEEEFNEAIKQHNFGKLILSLACYRWSDLLQFDIST